MTYVIQRRVRSMARRSIWGSDWHDVGRSVPGVTLERAEAELARIREVFARDEHRLVEGKWAKEGPIKGGHTDVWKCLAENCGALCRDDGRKGHDEAFHAEEVEPHEHIVVDEETYWGLMYLHAEVERQIEKGLITDGPLVYLSQDAEKRLALSRARNETDPLHHIRYMEKVRDDRAL